MTDPRTGLKHGYCLLKCCSSGSAVIKKARKGMASQATRPSAGLSVCESRVLGCRCLLFVRRAALALDPVPDRAQ
jgi:hypothetical protein